VFKTPANDHVEAEKILNDAFHLIIEDVKMN